MRRARRTAIPLAGAAALLLTAAALAASAAPASAQARERSAAVVRFPFPRDDGTLTPYTFELGYPLVTLIYDTITWRDATGIPRPWLARSVRTSGGGRRLSIRLRRGVRWHDGRPLTATDVAFTFRYMAARPHPRFTPQLRDVRRVVVRDRATVVIDLRRPSSGFLDQPLADMPILPRHLWEGLPAGSRAPEGLAVGSGPYRLVEHRPGRAYRFRANVRYFRGRPRARRIEVPIVGDAERVLRAFERRRVDMIPVSLPERYAQRVDRLSIAVERGPLYLGTVLMLNLRRPPFDRPEARRAIAEALDLTRIARAVGQAVPADRGYLHPASEWAPEAVLHRFDPSAARAALARLRLPEIRVLAPRNDPARREAGRQVVLALERAGTPARLEERSPAELSRAVGEDESGADFEAALWPSPPLASYDPAFLPTVFGSDDERAGLNYSGYRSAAFDELARRVATTTDRAGRRRLVEEELRLLARDAPVVPLLFPEGAFAHRPAAYDGWTFVKGVGILDKRSFLPAGGEASRGPSGEPGDSSGSGAGWGFPLGPLGLAALGLLVVALGVGAWALLARRA
jgi:peptide/nickel transport system substrate-binding protein